MNLKNLCSEMKSFELPIIQDSGFADGRNEVSPDSEQIESDMA